MEPCQHHDKVIEQAAANAAKLDILIEGQKEFKTAIEDLKKQLANVDKDSAVEKTKIKPLYFIIGAAGLIAVSKIGETLIHIISQALSAK